MNYSKDMERSIEYIEQRLKDPITAADIASHAGYSLYHFSRLFQACKNVSLMDYVKKRRLSMARQELKKSGKIIDVALNYRFETASGFSKAFRREFGYSPSTYQARVKSANDDNANKSLGGIIMEPVILQKPAFYVAGYGITTDISGSYTRDIAAYWNKYEGENLESRMYALLQPLKHGEVGICVPQGEDGKLLYLLGVIVEDLSKLAPDVISVTVPSAQYAVFTTLPVDTSAGAKEQDLTFTAEIQKTWSYIFEEWFPESGYQYDETKLDFEFYDERCHSRPDTVMEIYVPIQKITK